MLVKNILKEKMTKGVPVFGIWNTIASPIVTNVLAVGGCDFQILDLEHGPFILNHIHEHVSASESENCSLIVRVPSNQDWQILQALDQGAHGVVIPHIDTKKEVDNAAKYTKYYPEGERGFTPFSKPGGYTNTDKEYSKRANELTVFVAIIESLEGLSNLDSILENKNVDVIYFGAYDLSQALGYPGEPKHPAVVERISEAVIKVNNAGKVAGGFVPQSTDDIEWNLKLGMKFITYQVDTNILLRDITEKTKWLNDRYSS